MSIAALVLALVTLAISWLGLWLPLADNLNIAAAYWWPALVVAVLLATWRLRRRQVVAPAIIVLIAALGTGIVLFGPILQAAPPMGHRTVHVSMIEYNMLKTNPQSRADAEWLAAQDADILVLLEASRMQKKWGAVLQAKYPVMVSCSVHYPCSTVIFSRFPLLAHDALAGDGDADNRKALSALTARLDVEGAELTVFAAHLDRPWPLGEQENWIEPMRKVVAEVTGPAIMAGDFNSSPWTHAVRRIGASGNFRLGSGFTTSWPSDSPALLRLPLDQLYLRGRVEAEVRTGPQLGSDHLPLLIELDIAAGA